MSFSVDNIDTVKLLELLGPEKVDPVDVKAIKEKLFGYTTFWLTKEEPFGDLGEGVLFIGNLRGKREEIFAKLQRQLRELTGDKYNLFMVEEPNSEGDDPRGGPRVSFGLLRKEVSEPGPTTLWQYVISLLLFLLTMFSCVELGIASKVCLSYSSSIVCYFITSTSICLCTLVLCRLAVFHQKLFHISLIQMLPDPLLICNFCSHLWNRLCQWLMVSWLSNYSM